MDFLNNYTGEQRLAILQKNDGHRAWHTLNDRRFCIRCTRVFDGNQVRIATRSDGSHALSCPTEGCDSSSLHWLFCGSGLGQKTNFPTKSSPRAKVDFADW